MSDEREIVTDTAMELSRDIEMPLADFMEGLNAAIASIDLAHRHTAYIRFDAGDYDGPRGSFSVLWERPMTDEEIKANEDWKREMAERAEARDRAHYEALKRKFEPAKPTTGE